MQSFDSDDFLWEMAASEEGDLSSPPDEELRAYLGDRLEPEAKNLLESRLAQSPSGRARLIELAGVSLEAPSDEVRRRVLAHLPAPASPRIDHSSPKRSHRPLWLTAAAAVIAVVAVGYQWILPHRSDPAIAEFTVSQVGIKTDRSIGDDSHLADPSPFRAYPDTEVSIKAKILGEPVRKTEYGLYLRQADRLQRIHIPKRDTDSRTCTDFVATAREIVGETPAIYTLFVAAALPGTLPERVDLDGRDPIRALEEASRGRVQPVAPLQLLAEPQEDPDRTGSSEKAGLARPTAV